MFDNNEIKRALNFNFRATFFSQNAVGFLDEEVVLSNIERVRKMQSSLNGLDVEIIDASTFIDYLKDGYSSGISPDKLDISTSALKSVSFCIPASEYDFVKYILEIIEIHWTPIFSRGLIHSLLRNWLVFEIDIRSILTDFILEHIKNSESQKYMEIIPYLNVNGGYQLGYKLLIEGSSIYNCCKTFNISANRIVYTYFSDVLACYFENIQNCNYHEVGKVLAAHNNAYTDKRVVSRLLVNAWKTKNIHSELYEIAIKRIGYPSIESKWTAPENSTREDRVMIEEAKRIMQIVISSKFIHVFFNSLCQDKSRLDFWLSHVDYIKDFIVYGSQISRDSITYKLDPVTLDRYFKVVSGNNENCALVLFTTDYALVEFSLSGAFYAYRKDSDLYNQTVNRWIDKVDELKLGYLNNLVDTEYGGMSMRLEGRMIHGGNWQYRLDRWLHKMVRK